MSDLQGTIQAVQVSEIYGTLEAVPPVSISGSISGILYKDIIGHISGFDYESISGSYQGYLKQDLLGKISGKDHKDLSGFTKGYIGINVENNIYGYIKEKIASTNTISGTVSGVYYKEILGSVTGTLSGVDIGGQISGALFEGALIGTVSPTGSLNTLLGNIRAGYGGIPNTLSGNISGWGSDYILGRYVPDLNSTLVGEIEGIHIDISDIVGTLQVVQESSISGNINPNNRDLLFGSISSILPQDLYGIITPDVYYIDSSIPINTYLVQDLFGFINADDCVFKSSFRDLQGYISGVNYADLYGSLIAIAGQYASVKNYITTTIKNRSIYEDWILIVTDTPALYENYIPITVTQSPLSDLHGYIEGLHASKTLSGTIMPVYISSVAREGVPIGRLVNTKTGDIKLLRLFFKGSANTFYYSSINHKSYSANSEDSLIVVAESYTKDELESESLLDIKRNIRRCEVNNLQDFTSIDEAIKYAITCAANQIHSDLSASINSTGELQDLRANIQGIDSRFIKNLRAKIVPVANEPTISGNIEPSGGFIELKGMIKHSISSNTQSMYIDSLGEKLIPRLVLHGDNEYSIVLTKVVSSGTIDIAPSPDLSGHIIGYRFEDISATISGL